MLVSLQFTRRRKEPYLDCSQQAGSQNKVLGDKQTQRTKGEVGGDGVRHHGGIQGLGKAVNPLENDK